MNTTNNWNDFNDADSQQSGFDVIPKGTVVPVRMTLKPGGFDDHNQGWTGGYATESFDTGAVYLACEFVVTLKTMSNYGLVEMKREKNHVRPIAMATEFRIVA